MSKQKLKLTNFYLDKDQHEQLKVTAFRQRRSMGAILRGLIAKWLKHQLQQ